MTNRPSKLCGAARRTLAFPLLVGALAAGPVGCESEDPGGSTSPGTTTATGGTGGATGSGGSGGEGGGPEACATPDDNVAQQNDPSCKALEGDYVPGSGDDGWDACISDDDAYHPFEPNISTIARIAAFEEIADHLSLGQGVASSPQEFLDARVAYSIDEGLESRVSRREDEHYPPAPKACNELTPDEQQEYADRCVGPAKIQPLLNAAFADGVDGKDPALNAARVEAALLWFLYVSAYKEATTCAKTQKDCDSSYAYYTGGEPREGGLGLSRYVRARSTQAHDRTWDGILAVRCWRDLDNPTGEAQDLDLRDQALAQLDRALLRGVAVVVRQRIQTLPCDAAWETAKILGPVLDREATERDPDQAAILRAEFAKSDPSGVDVDAAVAALDALFPCP